MKIRKQTQQQGAKRGNLNMGIARAHEVAAQLVGIQLAASNLIALTVSASSIVAGTITYAVLNQPGAWLFWLAAGVIGALLALLIEGMTLGALIRIRLANKQIHTIVAKLEAERDEAAKLTGGKHQGQYKWWPFRKRRQYATRTYRKSRRYSIPLAFIGATASATAGGLFYHQILGSLGTIQSIGVSALFALIVTGTFVSSELFRDVQEEAVRESFKGGSLSEEALREETYRQTNQAVAVEVSTYLASQDAKDAIKEAASQLLGDVLSELRRKSADRVGRVAVTPERDTTLQPPVALIPQNAGGDTTEATRHPGPEETRQKQRDTTASQPNATRQGDMKAAPMSDTTGRHDNSAAMQYDTTASRRHDSTQAMQGDTTGTTFSPELSHDNEVHTEPLATARSRTTGTTRQLGTAAKATFAQEQQDDRDDNPTTERHDIHTGPMAAVRHDSQQAGRHDSDNIRPFRKATTPLSEQATRQGDATAAPMSDTTAKGDITASDILAYQAEHPNEKQADVARAFGVTVRTIQRKLAAQLKAEESAS